MDNHSWQPRLCFG